MSQDWIKMRVSLLTHPKVMRMVSALKADRFRIVGGMLAVWAVFDTHSEDGHLAGYTAQTMDETIGWRGFSAAMRAVGWLEEDEEGLTAPDFEEHNSKSAKRRALDSSRKNSARDADKTANGSWAQSGSLSASDADKTRTREREEKEKKKPSVSARGARLPPDWDPGEPGLAFAAQQGLVNGRAQAELAKFRDHWASATGQSASKADWQAAWRNWVRRAVETAPVSRFGVAVAAPEPVPDTRATEWLAEQAQRDREVEAQRIARMARKAAGVAS